MDVFFYEAFREEREALEAAMPAELTSDFTEMTIQEAGDTRPPAPLISIRTQSVIPLRWQDQLSGILTRSTGYDHLERYSIACQGVVPCGYLPKYCSRSVAEQALLLWMGLLRKLPRQISHFGEFNRDDLTGAECAGKVLLVVGVGNIGSEIVRIGQGLGMEVLGVDLLKKFEFVTYVTPEQGLKKADIVTCAMNLTAENQGYFNCETLKKASRGVIFVNIARGELSPSTDLLKLIDEDYLGGIGLDVYSNESELAVCARQDQSSDDPEVRATFELVKRSRVICTPHNAFNTREAIERKTRHSLKQIDSFLTEGRFLWPVPGTE